MTKNRVSKEKAIKEAFEINENIAEKSDKIVCEIMGTINNPACLFDEKIRQLMDASYSIRQTIAPAVREKDEIKPYDIVKSLQANLRREQKFDVVHYSPEIYVSPRKMEYMTSGGLIFGWKWFKRGCDWEFDLYVKHPDGCFREKSTLYQPLKENFYPKENFKTIIEKIKE